MKEFLPKHNSLYQYFRERFIRETNATGVEQEMDNEYYQTNRKRLFNACCAFGIDKKLFKHKDLRMYNVTDDVKMLFDFLLDEILEKTPKQHRRPKQISLEKWENLRYLLYNALQSCNVTDEDMECQMQMFGQKREEYVENENSCIEYWSGMLPAQYFRGTSLEMTPVVGNDPTLSEEEFRNAYELPISPLEI